MKALAENFIAFWRGRNPHERRLLGGLAVFLAAAALAQGLWLAHDARERLHQQIPQLRSQLAGVQRQSGEILQMRAQPAPSTQEGAALLAAATAAARSAGLPEAAAQMQLENPRQLRLRGTLPFDKWLEWVAAVQRDARLRVVSCRVETAAEAAAPAGYAKIDALLSLPDPS